MFSADVSAFRKAGWSSTTRTRTVIVSSQGSSGLGGRTHYSCSHDAGSRSIVPFGIRQGNGPLGGLWVARMGDGDPAVRRHGSGTHPAASADRKISIDGHERERSFRGERGVVGILGLEGRRRRLLTSPAPAAPRG